MAITPRLRPEKKSNGEHGIQILMSWTEDKKTKTKAVMVKDDITDTALSVPASMWDNNKRRVKKTHAQHDRYNRLIRAHLEAAEKVYPVVSNGHAPVKEKKDIINSMFLMPKKGNSPMEIMELYKEKGMTVSKATFRLRKSVWESLMRYEQVYGPLKWNSFNRKFGEQYVQALAGGAIGKFEKPLSPTTVVIYMSTIGNFLKWVRKTYDGFWDYGEGWNRAMEATESLDRGNREPTPLYTDEIDEMWNMDRDLLTKREEIALDMWMLAYYTARRKVEMMNVKMKDIHQTEINGEKCMYINFYLAKKRSKRQYRKPVLIQNDIAIGIVNKYRTDNKEERLFPKKPASYATRSIKSVAFKAGLTREITKTIREGVEVYTESVPVYEDLGMHDARHSAAVNLLAEGKDPYAVSELLGHASINMTIKTYNQASPFLQLIKQQKNFG